MQWTSDEQQEWFDYVFQHKYNRVEQAAKRLEKKRGQVPGNLSSKREEGLQSECTIPDDDATMEFELAIVKFERPDGWWCNVDQWLEFLRELAGENHSSKFDEMKTRLQQIREGKIELILNQKKITDYVAYKMIARRVFFAGDLDASAHEQYLLKHAQTHQHLWKKYHTYCTRLWDFLQEVHGYRSKHNIRKPVSRNNICIYCKGTEGDFNHVEHTIPESLGNEYNFLLKGFVCRDCTLKLNNLEDGINEMLPFSLVLVTTSTGNKKGKLPTYKSGPLHIHKKSPNKMEFMSFGKKSKFKEEPMPGGRRISFNTSAPSGHFDAHRVARVLYKAALGEVALALGNDRNTVLDPKFDDVRRYIIKGGTFSNKMMFFKKALTESHMETKWYEVDGVPKVKFVIQGIIFIIVLGERPKFEPNDELKPHVTMFDLSLDRPETGIE